MNFRFDILPGSQRALWPELGNASLLGFVLYGGTAAALRFGHRQSVDFDFFSSEIFSEHDILRLFPWLKDCQKIQDDENSYSYLTKTDVKITFLGNFAIGRVGRPDMDCTTGIQIASPEDIFALKLKAVHDRIAQRDFLDIAEFIRQGYSLEHAIIGSQTLIQGMLPAQFTIQTLMWYAHPEFANFPQCHKDTIISACQKVDLAAVADCALPLASPTLHDAGLFQTFKK